MSIFGNIGHFLFGGKGKTTGETQGTSAAQTQTTTAPWAAAQPGLTSMINDLGTLYGPGGAPQISPYEQQGYDALQQTATGPQATDAAVAENNKTLSGQYLTPDTNPYLADIASRVGSKALQSVNSTFGGMGRTGSGLHQNVAAEGVGNAMTDLYGQSYEAERGRMGQAVGQAPALQASQYLPSQALIQAGQSISARPFDVAAQRASVMDNIAKLGGTSSGTANTQTSGTSSGTSQAESSGLVGNFIKKLFA